MSEEFQDISYKPLEEVHYVQASVSNKFCSNWRSSEGTKIKVFISSEIPYVYWNEDELEDIYSKTRPQLKCLIDGEYSI